ncbi:MAG: gliding motility-associated C-terminal domain-containing protein [Sphingobacteriaceae bacterium]|nr:MAG: gliding motility-associated C-terminal domain-containing protein [Sphingobacteriaceae bacterium]
MIIALNGTASASVPNYNHSIYNSIDFGAGPGFFKIISPLSKTNFQINPNVFFTSFSDHKRSIILTAFITITALTNFIGYASAQNQAETTLNFNPQKIFTSSEAQTFTIRGTHLSDRVTVSTNPPFLLSKENKFFYTEITYDTVELVSNQTVYVKFQPKVIGYYADSIVTTSAGADRKIISLTGKASIFNSNSNNNRLTANNDIGQNGAFKSNSNSQRLAANNVITPNGDGRNDTWIINNIEQYPNNTVRLMDKFGHVIYSKRGYNNDWDGTYQNAPLPQGTYYYVVDFGEGLDMVFNGYITIVRD